MRTNHPPRPLPFLEGDKIRLGDTPSSPVRNGSTLLYIPHEPTLIPTMNRSFTALGEDFVLLNYLRNTAR